jgi:eukaryotic-like serine/threonine-protein kinase
LNPENIVSDTLPSCGDILIIGDFGISKKDLENIRNSQTLKGLTTPAYMAPEMLTKAEKPSTKKVDMWALGVILYELSAGQLPFKGKN